ncbi:MAG: PH domain-containing protein [Thermoleophilia bacterium]
MESHVELMQGQDMIWTGHPTRKGALGWYVRAGQGTRPDRVQNLNTFQSPVERVLNVGDLDFDTAGECRGTFCFSGVAHLHDIAVRVQQHLAGYRPVGTP